MAQQRKSASSATAEIAATAAGEAVPQYQGKTFGEWLKYVLWPKPRAPDPRNPSRDYQKALARKVNVSARTVQSWANDEDLPGKGNLDLLLQFIVTLAGDSDWATKHRDTLNAAWLLADAKRASAYAKKRAAAKSTPHERHDSPTNNPTLQTMQASGAIARILSPLASDTVRQRTEVTGQTERLLGGVRLWLVVEIGWGGIYPQCPISSSIGHWKSDVRIGRAGPGLDEGAEYTICLTAVGPDSDYQFNRYIRGQHECRDGMGSLWPHDVQTLQRLVVIRGPN